MRSYTKKLLFALFSIMAYLSMATSYALPAISVAEQSQDIVEVDMDMGMGMDMSMMDCHHQQANKKCTHCIDQHNCNSAHSSCSISVGIASQYDELNVNKNTKPHYLTLRVTTLFQQTIPLFRPPISL